MNYILVINGTSVTTEQGDFIEILFQSNIQTFETFNASIDALKVCLSQKIFAGIYKWDSNIKQFLLQTITIPDENIIKHINSKENEPRQNTDIS